MEKIRIATRKSRLALAQAEIVSKKITENFPETQVEIIKVTTRGDRERRTQNLKHAFTEEIERMVLNNEADAAVHSLKDIPSDISEEIVIESTPVRDDPRDAFVSSKGRLEQLQMPRIGTSSLRRAVQLRLLKGDVQIYPLRGNVDTRISKYEQLGLDGIVLSAAGLRRLGISSLISYYFDTSEIVPSPGQGTIAVEVLKENKKVRSLFSRINDTNVYVASKCEREFMKSVGGGCEVPCGAYAELLDDKIRVIGFVASQDGKYYSKKTATAPVKDAEELGRSLANELLEDIRKCSG